MIRSQGAERWAGWFSWLWLAKVRPRDLLVVHRLWSLDLSRVSLGTLPFPERENLQGMGRWMHAKSLQSCLICNPMAVACQAPLSMGFSWQEYWSGLPCPPPRDLPDSGIKSTSLSSPALAGEFFTTSATWGWRCPVFSERVIGGWIRLLLARMRRRQWHPTPVPLPGKSHGRRSLVGCSLWGL